MIFVSSCPARPTKGMPLASSSAPGASPKNTSRASGRPVPKTVCVRPAASSAHRMQAATSARKTSSEAGRDAATAGDAGCTATGDGGDGVTGS